MFNSDHKKKAMKDMEYAIKKYDVTHKDTMNSIIALHGARVDAVALIKQIEIFINTIANRPKEFEKIIDQIQVNRQSFENNMGKLKIENKNAATVSGSVAAVGIVSGVGVAAFGPTAAMAVATTYGTASTGTAIATLSGASATNAALAWLGGGAVAAGGGGMAAGQAFLALAGPVGWAIGGAALLGGGVFLNGKNKQIAEKAESTTQTINQEKADLKKIQAKVDQVKKLTTEHIENLRSSKQKMLSKSITNYSVLSEDEKKELGAFVNDTKALSALINREVS